MLYYSKKKKIRGWKRHKRKIEAWKQSALHLDMEYLKDYQRDYVKLWIDPFYGPFRRSAPAWYKRLLLEAIIDVYKAWHKKMKKENEEFYLKIWLYDPDIMKSQIVVAYRDCISFYHETFEKMREQKEFPFKKFPGLEDKLEQFEWDLRIDIDYYDEADLNDLIAEGASKENEIEAIKNKAYKTRKIQDGNGTYLQYLIDKGDVWVGTLKC